MKKKIKVPEEIEVEVDGDLVRVKKNSSSLEKKLDYPGVKIEFEDKEVVVSPKKERKSDNAIVGTYASHIRNMIEGIQKPFVYELKSVYTHFPSNVKVQGDEVLIENFMGERNPRRIKIYEGVDVEVEGEIVRVKGHDKEKVAQTAARIEQKCYKGNRDPRKFQDGVYITKKGDKNA